MSNRPADKLAIAVAQLNATVGDVSGNADKVRRGAQGSGRARRGHRSAARAFHRRLSAGRPRAQAVFSGRLPICHWKASRAKPATAVRRVLVGVPWVEKGKLYNAVALAGRRPHRGAPFQGRSAELRRVRRKARVCVRSDARAGELPRCAGRRADLRGHLGTGSRSNVIAETGGEILLVANASPYRRGVGDERLNTTVPRVTETGLPLDLCQPDRRAG